MTLNPETLRRLRRRYGYSQQDLADLAKVSKRTIARLEAGKAQSENRSRTIHNLARVLKVEADKLSAPPSDDDMDYVGEEMQRIMTLVTRGTMLDYQMVEDRYGVSIDALVSAAPWLFSVLAEMSLLDRREKLEVSWSHLSQLRKAMASHLGQAPEPFVEIQARLDTEKASLAGDDVFGRTLPQFEEWPEVEDHPFAAFLAAQATRLENPNIDPCELETQLCDPLPIWSVHIAWLNDLSGGDPVAAYAMRAGLVCVSDIPDELKGDARAAERIAFLHSYVPIQEKIKIQKNHKYANVGDRT